MCMFLSLQNIKSNIDACLFYNDYYELALLTETGRKLKCLSCGNCQCLCCCFYHMTLVNLFSLGCSPRLTSHLITQNLEPDVVYKMVEIRRNSQSLDSIFNKYVTT